MAPSARRVTSGAIMTATRSRIHRTAPISPIDEFCASGPNCFKCGIQIKEDIYGLTGFGSILFFHPDCAAEAAEEIISEIAEAGL